MFFRKDYAKPGPGIRDDEPEKFGWSRFVEILSIECGSLVKLNLLFLLTSLPLVTIPVSLYAMHIVVRRMVCDETVDCVYHYKTAFRQYWKTAYAAFFITAVPIVCGGFGMWTYLRFAMTSPMFLLPFVFCSTVFLIALLSSTCFYAALSTGKKIREVLRPSIILGIVKPARSVLSAVCSYGAVAAAILALPISVPYLLLIGFSMPCLLANFFMRILVRQYF